jgi:hypothetical protein
VRSRAASVVCGLAVLAAACTPTGTATTAGADTTAVTELISTTNTQALSSTQAVGEPTFVATYDRDGFYTEGSYTHLELFMYSPVRDDVPVPIAIVDQQAPPSGTVLAAETLAPGVYELRSYQRPCVGSCGVLESPSDGCAVRFTVEAGASVEAAVTVRPGSACLIDVDGAAMEAPVLDMALTLQPAGAAGCQPESPHTDANVMEVLATASGDAVAWGLIWPPLDGRVKMVFRVTGDGDLGVVARHEDGTEIVSDWRLGDGATDASSYGRPGPEWNMLFDFPRDGCWNIHLTRGNDTADVWLNVTTA